MATSNKVTELFSGDVAELACLRQIEAWLLSPDFPQRPPPEIALILSLLRAAPLASLRGSFSHGVYDPYDIVISIKNGAQGRALR